MHDIVIAIRQLRKSAGFTAVAVLSIALGIGANTAIFSLVNEMLLRSLPVSRPDELVLFRAIHGVRGRMSHRGEGPGFTDAATGRSTGTPFSLLAFERLRANRSALSDVFAFAPFSQVNVLVEGRPETSVSAQYVSGTYYTGLGVRTVLGRAITTQDDVPSAAPVAVLSYRYWAQRFQRDPAVLGRTIQLNAVAATIVGVSARGFDGAMQAGETADISVPIAHHGRFQPHRAQRAQPFYWWVRIMGRLVPGATRIQAAAALEPVFQEAAREGWRAGPTTDRAPSAMPDAPLLVADPGAQGENDTRRQYRRSLLVLMGLVSLVLLAACANVANLLLARGSARRTEVALRLALGAGRWRVVRQLLTESLVLGLAGAALGVAFAWWGRGLLVALRPFGQSTVVLDLPLDGRVLTFTAATALATALVFGLAPAWRATRMDMAAAFQGGARTLGGSRRSRLARGLMVVQIALSLVLLVATGLFVRTLGQLQQVSAGFNHRGLVLFRVDATSAGYAPDRAASLHALLRERLAAVPGVQAATFSSVALLSRVRQNRSVTVPGATPAPDAPRIVNTNGLAVNFFAAMELPVLIGRAFTERDDAKAPGVAIVNQTFARMYFGRERPMGRQIVFSGPGGRSSAEIVGVAGDAKYTDLRSATPPTIYMPALQMPDATVSFAVRAAGDPGALFPAIRAVVRDVDPTLPVLDLRTQDEQIDRLHAQERLFARLSGFFGLVALLLACVGLHGLMSYAVWQRTGEIGLRMALGARPGQVLRMMLRESLLLVALGALTGLTLAYGASRVVATMLFEVSPTDPLVYGSVAAMLIAVALAASLHPARRASRIEPLDALRADQSI